MSLTITRPDDWHLHLRDGAQMAAVVGWSAEQFGRALIMPNLRPPITEVASARAYRQRIVDALPDGAQFDPYMALYLTQSTTLETLKAAAQDPHILAVKLYPAGATTHSDAGVRDIERVMPQLEAMAELNIPLCVHGEVVDADVDIFDREAHFIDKILVPLIERLPTLRVVMEHITTAQAVEFVSQAPEQVAATITPQHLLYNRNAMLVGGIQPHYYCLPILKRERHRQALNQAAISGSGKFFLGTDSAPHSRDSKEHSCGCAGVFSAPMALALYAEAFDALDALPMLEGFTSHFGADFYQLPRNQSTVTLSQAPWSPPEDYPYAQGRIRPIRAGESVAWRVEAAQ